MRILLISLPGGHGTDEPLFPLGIGYLVAVLKKEHQVKVAHYQKFEHVDPTLPDLINSFRPDLVGLTCTTFNRGNVRKVASVIKKYCPNIKVVLGGVHASFLPDQMLNGYGADAVVIGEGEYTSLELCRALENGTSLDDVKGIAFKRAGSVVVTPPRPPIENLDELPMPDYDFAEHLMKTSGMGFIITSRGCPVRCIFCSTSSYWGQNVRKTSVARVVDEMEYLIDRYKVRKIFFHDDTFNLGTERVKEICYQIMRRKINIEWAVDCRVTPASQEMVDLMAEAGCRHICWGVETGSDTMLKSLEKKITRDQIRNAYEFTKKHSRNMSSGAFAMVGSPGETDQTIRETVEFFNTIPLTDHPSTAMLCLLPGTKIYFDMKSRGLVEDSIWLRNDEIPRTGEHPEAVLHRWSQMVSSSGNMLPFDKKQHFWNNVLFGDIPKAQLPRFIIDQSESQCKAAYNTNNTNQNSPVEKLNVPSQPVLPSGNNDAGPAINFFTIVLNGEPFIRYHIDVFKKLPFRWHWHIIEGVADLKHDTAWSLEQGGRISSELHRNGRSNDGTTEYLNELVRQYPENVTVYRKGEGVFWDGKLEMVNAPLANIKQECLLWQVDSDELWTPEQIKTVRDMFMAEPDRTAAYYLAHFFVGEDLVTTTIDTYGNNTSYEWLRTWRFKPGYRWAAHEPPRLCMPVGNDKWADIAAIKPFKHNQTSDKGLIFQHYAYATEKQLGFKEIYYGYKSAIAQWRRLQRQHDFPVFLKDYFAWVKDAAQVNTIKSQHITPIARTDNNDRWYFGSCHSSLSNCKKVLIVRPDAIGDFVIFSNVLPNFKALHPEAKISILLQDTVAKLAQNCPYVDEIITFKESQIRDAQYRSGILTQLQSWHFDIAYYPVYSRNEIGDLLTLQSGAVKKVTFSGDCSNISAQLKSNNDKNYDMLIPSVPGVLLETQRNREFMKGLGVDVPDSQGTCIWSSQKDEDYIVELLKGLNVNSPVVISPFARFDIKDWPIEKWAQLLSRYPDENILICAGPEDYERAQKLIMLSSHRHIYNLCGKTTLSQTAAIMGHCKLYIGVDTGPAHMAIAANIPNVVLMGGGHLGRFMPYSPSTTMVYCHVSCVGCNWRCKFGTKPAPCLAQISVPTVIKAIDAAVSMPVARRKEPLVIAEPFQTQTSQIAENSSLDWKPAKDAVSYELVREKINKVTGFLVQDDERFLFEVAKSLPDDATIVEIGSYKGRSTCCLAYACIGTRKKVYSIDICFANATGFAEWKENVGRNGLLDYVTPIAGNSKNIATQWDKGIDFIFIDGSHSYLPVLSDFIGFYPWVKDNGVIAFHDVGPGFTGPMRVWQENAKPLLYDTGLCGGIAFGRKIPVGASLNKTRPAEQLSIAKYHTREHSLPPRHSLQVVEFDLKSKSHPVPLADTKSHKVLIVHTGSAGDVMLFMNLLHVYRKNYSGSHLAVCVEEKVADIVLPCPYIDEVITFNADAAQKDTGYLKQLASQIRSRKLDVVIHPVYSRTQAGDFITLESGAKEKIGFDNTEGEMPPAMRSANNPLYTKLVSVFEPAMSEIGKYDFFAHSLNMRDVDILDPPLWVTSDDISYVDNLLRTQGINSPIVVHPFSNNAATQWPVHNWTKLISHYKDYPIIITGRKEYREKGDELVRDLQQQNVYNMCGQLTLRQSAVLLHGATLCVTSESDVPHFACAVDCPNVVVTDGRQFGRYLPYNKITTLVYVPMKCFNCQSICGYPECSCITKLKIETVRKAIDEFLNGFPKDHLPLLPQIDSVSILPYKSVYYRVEEIEPVRDMYQQGLKLIQSNDIANARTALEGVVTRLSPLMTMGVQWKTADESEHYYDTVKYYINACTTLAQCYMQTGEFGKLKAVYQHLLENPVLGFSDEQISAFRTVIAKLQKVEPDNGMFVVTAASQIVESPVFRPTETEPKYLISAIVSTYNAGKFIRGCLEDLESQTIADKLEIIVVDSGSQENEAAIVKEFQQRYSNIRYMRTERETIYGAWNRAIKAASGKYITNANTDDRHYKDSLEKLAIALEQNPKKVIAYGNLHAGSTLDGDITGELRSKQGGHLELLSGLFWLESQPMWRRDLHDAVGYFDEQFFCSGDYELWIRATQRFEMLYVDIFTGKKLMNEAVVSLANKHMQSLENLIIAQSYEYAMQTREPIGKQGISGDARLADWPEIKVWKRLVAAKLSGRKWQSSDEIVDVKDMRTGNKPKLSVIVIETEATKWQSIRSLISQSDQDFELILIACRSLPSQLDLAPFTGRICIVQLKDDIGASFARNFGIAHTKGDFVAYLDSSMQTNPGWVEAIFRQLANPKMMAARGQIIDNNDTTEEVITESYATFCSSADNCAFRKSVLLEAKGFDEDMFALEGHELSCRICELANNALDVIRFEPGMLVRLDVNISESQQIVQKIRSSHMQKRLWRKHNDVLGYIEFYHSQDPALSWQYDNDYLRIVAIAVFLQKGHPELAMKWAQKAVTLDPSRIKGRYLLGSFYFGMGSYDKTVALLEPVLLTQLRNLGNEDVSDGPEHRAINADLCMSAGTMLAQCYMKQGQYGKLKKVYTLLLNSPHVTMPPEQRASIQALLGKLQNVEDVPVQAAASQIDSPARYPLKPESCVNAADERGEKYLVSAIVSTYNSETFIRGCLEDLENQTIADKLEIIVVNSGSEQNEESIVKEFQEKYGNIVYIKTEHEGLYSAWNRAIKAASGQFLTSANTDDRHRRDALEVMASTLLKNTDVVLVYGNQIITDTPNPSFENHHVIEMAKRAEFSRQRLLFGCCVGSQPMWRKSLHGEFGGFDETLVCAADWDFWLKIAQRHSFKHIDEFMGLFYRNENGIEHGREIHSLYERYAVGKRYGNPYISVIKQYDAPGNPLVSIIVTAYNAADYISRAIESILIQSYRNFEIIVVDDGSTDNTADIVREFKNEPIKYFFKENGGVASARNFGLQKSGGSFIIMLDSDDMMTPDYIASHLQGFEQHPEADMVYCDDLLIDEQDKPIRVINRPEYSNPDGIISDMFRCGFPVVHFKTCIKRSVFDKLGLYDERLIVAEDYDMMRRFVKQQLKMRHLPAALYLRRLRADSLSKGFNAVKAKSHFDVIRRFTETFTPEQLFPDVQWNKLPAEQKTMLTKCREALAYLGIGEQYINSKAPDYAEAAFDMACEQLDDCCKIEPANQQVRNLREKCQSIRDKRMSKAGRTIYQQV